ncbi:MULTISPECIES: hypothetical protein [unclassified Nocardia]|uniref:anthrax toxin lethal factor-related metalloendopeptidase n=1 Tax=unclassified Nocardia TaxID=2637762 RepID=UPI0024A9F33D|nr:MULTISPECIES: hypothetical protein [unclassified Nocardia]
MRISRAISDLFRKRVTPAILRASEAIERDAGIMREVGGEATATARAVRGTDRASHRQILASTGEEHNGQASHDFGNGTSTRLSDIYGDRLRIVGQGPVPERHLRDLERLPDSFHRKMLGYFASHPKGGIDIVAGSVTDVMPELRGVTPRGWPANTTWDDVPGLHDLSTHRVVLGDRGDHGSVSLAVHEVGHAFDRALLDASDSDDFRQLYDKLGSMMPYYAQPGSAGRQETLAESLAAWALNRHMPPDHRDEAIAESLGITKSKQAQGSLLDSYFSNLQHRLEAPPL